jgi:hypothetical protein
LRLVFLLKTITSVKKNICENSGFRNWSLIQGATFDQNRKIIAYLT